MRNFIIAALAALLLAGCSTNPTKDQGKIDVNVATRKVEFVEVDRAILDKCEKPRRLSEQFPDIKTGKVREKDLVEALVNSYTNETNCYLVKQEVIRTQDKLREEIKKANK